MEIEGKFTLKKREDGRFDVSFEPKEEGKAPKRSRSFSSYDGMRRYLLEVGVRPPVSATSRSNRAGLQPEEWNRDQDPGFQH
jgi:hypothetical protein